MKYCPNCGCEVQQDKDICLKCGVLLNSNSYQEINQKNNIPGKGLSIAGMILGIISLLLAIIIL